MATVVDRNDLAKLEASATAAGVDVFWIGGKRIGTAGGVDDWAWVDGNSFDFTNWLDGEVGVCHVHRADAARFRHHLWVA